MIISKNHSLQQDTPSSYLHLLGPNLTSFSACLAGESTIFSSFYHLILANTNLFVKLWTFRLFMINGSFLLMGFVYCLILCSYAIVSWFFGVFGSWVLKNVGFCVRFGVFSQLWWNERCIDFGFFWMVFSGFGVCVWFWVRKCWDLSILVRVSCSWSLFSTYLDAESFSVC